ncbi:UNVERIFIED_CONTAM: hypothetical protein NCL1_12902 [Trichonephila clavipes]
MSDVDTFFAHKNRTFKPEQFPERFAILIILKRLGTFITYPQTSCMTSSAIFLYSGEAKFIHNMQFSNATACKLFFFSSSLVINLAAETCMQWVFESNKEHFAESCYAIYLLFLMTTKWSWSLTPFRRCQDTGLIPSANQDSLCRGADAH